METPIFTLSPIFRRSSNKRILLLISACCFSEIASNSDVRIRRFNDSTNCRFPDSTVFRIFDFPIQRFPVFPIQRFSDSTALPALVKTRIQVLTKLFVPYKRLCFAHYEFCADDDTKLNHSTEVDDFKRKSIEERRDFTPVENG